MRGSSVLYAAAVLGEENMNVAHAQRTGVCRRVMKGKRQGNHTAGPPHNSTVSVDRFDIQYTQLRKAVWRPPCIYRTVTQVPGLSLV